MKLGEILEHFPTLRPNISRRTQACRTMGDPLKAMDELVEEFEVSLKKYAVWEAKNFITNERRLKLEEISMKQFHQKQDELFSSSSQLSDHSCAVRAGPSVMVSPQVFQAWLHLWIPTLKTLFPPRRTVHPVWLTLVLLPLVLVPTKQCLGPPSPWKNPLPAPSVPAVPCRPIESRLN